MTMELTYSLERTILICAERSTVFQFFTDSRLFADWWGKGSEIEGRKGGAVRICFPGGAITASGQILEIQSPARIVFTYGFDSGKPIPPGSSRVTITLEDHSEGTLLALKHEFPDEKVRDEHVQGWRFQLALFANAASREQFSKVAGTVDAYFDMWNMLDGADRKRAMDPLLAPEVQFRDQYSCTQGQDDLNAHITAGKHFMPGLSLVRDDDVRQCQGTALANWIARREDGSEVARGTNVFELTPDGRIRRITGFWNPRV
jgi:uncharacterized protein YndB with AHSA1/START domain